ncbi:MAG TPA: peptidase inhibitor family I36 protein [Pilimelia sp.]|nr:peptidase inhibitor family I36 protein [Pilimelia sp.]
MSHKIVTAATLACGVMLTAAPAGASPAAPVGHQCPVGSICFYEHINFEGRIWSWNRGETERWLRTTGANDVISSIINNTSMTVRAHRHEFNRGDWVCVNPSSAVADLRGHNLNDAISSFESSADRCVP